MTVQRVEKAVWCIEGLTFEETPVMQFEVSRKGQEKRMKGQVEALFPALGNILLRSCGMAPSQCVLWLEILLVMSS